MSRVGSTLANLLTQLPLYLVWIVGIILAITSWQKHRRASLLTLIGLGILLLQALTGALLTPAFVRFLHVRGMGGRMMNLVMIGRSVLAALISTAAWGCILAGIFLPRRSESPTPT